MARYIKRTAVAVFLAIFLGLLAVNGFVSGDFGTDDSALVQASHSDVPNEIIHGGPLIVSNGTSTRSVRIPDKTIVLSFEDGPDPEWTPRVLEVLKANDVRATFFMVGSRIASHPDVAKQVHGQDNEIGLHTFSHANLAEQSKRREHLELTESQLALAGAADVTTSLFRPPYSASPGALDNNSWPVVDQLAKSGYLIGLSSIDSQDLKTSDIDRIVKSSTPPGNTGATIAMHDYGGDRQHTVAALERLIPALKASGYAFSTTGQVLNHNPTSAAASSDVTRGNILVATVQTSQVVANAFTALLFVAGILVTARLLIMLLVSRKHAKTRSDPDFWWGSDVTAPVSVIVPAYNEGPCIADTIRSLLASTHRLEIIVVDDGSTDDTAAIAEGLGADNVRVVRKPNGGKASALNAGIALARNELVVMMDGDTVFEPDTVRRLVQPFADPTVGAVAGNAKVANRRGLIGGWQHIEYVVGFNIDRRVYDLWQCMPTIAGAIGAFRRSVLRDVGGLSNATLAEDTDLTMSICRAGWRVVYEDNAYARTEAPASLSQLWKQRYRWSYGTMQSMWKHRRAVIERGPSGRLGRRGLLNLALFQILLPLTSPLVDIFLIYGLIFLDPAKTLVAWLAMLAVQTVTAAYAFRLDRERLRALWLLPLQQFVYRQVMYFVLLQSVLSAVGGIRMGWQKLARTGGLGDLLDAQRAAEAVRPAYTTKGFDVDDTEPPFARTN